MDNHRRDIIRLRKIKKQIKTAAIVASILYLIFTLIFDPKFWFIAVYGVIVSIFFL